MGKRIHVISQVTYHHLLLLYSDLILMATSKNVIPAKAGIQNPLISLDSGRSLPRTRYGAGVTN